MNFYYDRKDFMVGHVLSEYYKYYQGNTCKGCEKREREKKKRKKKALANPNLLGRASKFLVRSLNNIIYCM